MQSDLEVELLKRDAPMPDRKGLVDELDRKDGTWRVEWSGFLDAGLRSASADSKAGHRPLTTHTLPGQWSLI